MKKDLIESVLVGLTAGCFTATALCVFAAFADAPIALLPIVLGIGVSVGGVVAVHHYSTQED